MGEAMEFIYQRTAKRIREKIKETGLSYRQVYLSDSKILSCIVECKRTRKNKFLVPDRVFIDFENGDGLIPKVFFPEENGRNDDPKKRVKAHKVEILWGTEDERREYAKELFTKIMSDLYNGEDSKKYEDIFCSYIPYSKAYTYKEVVFSPMNEYPAMFYGVREDDIVFPEKYLTDSIEFLYREVETQYKEAFIQYTNEKDTFKNVEKDFCTTFVKGTIVPILEEYIEREHPLGLRVRELIQGELARVPTILGGTMDKKEQEYYRKLNRATTDYFSALEKIQAQKHE